MIIEVPPHGSDQLPKQIMTNLDRVDVSPREQQVLNLLVQGCSNKDIGGQLSISLRTVKQHLRMLFSRAGIREGGKRVKLARYARENEGAVMTPCSGLTPREIQVSILVWEGLTNHEIGKMVGTFSWLGISFLGMLILSPALMGQASKKSGAALPATTDWSQHHLIFSKPATTEKAKLVERDPRYW